MSRPTPDLLISPKWLIPVVPHGTVLENHSLLIGGGRILDILPTGAQSFPELRHIELPQHALIPGLINMHTHAAMNLMRGIADGASDLAGGDAGRFMNAVSLRVAPPRSSATRPDQPKAPAEPVPTADEAPRTALQRLIDRFR